MGRLMVSVSGLRGVVGDGLDPPTLVRYVAAYAGRLQRGASRPVVAVGTDTRPSRDMVLRIVAGTLQAAGCDVVDLGICPTPSVQLMMDKLGAAGAVVVTASHNPEEWNACKFYGSSGMLLTREEAERMWAVADSGRFDWVDWRRLGACVSDDGAAAAQIEAALSVADVGAVRKLSPLVVVDCVNGAGSVVTPAFLAELGCRPVLINADVDAGFPHTPEPVPENLGQLCRAVSERGADIGFAQDPDADRLAIVSERGEAIGEEYTLALSALRVLSKRKGTVVANLSTSRMVDDVAERFGCKVARSAVGEANVAQLMRRSGAVIGGEGNGGVMDPAVHLVRDSFVGMAHVLSLMAETGKSVSGLVGEIPAYVMLKKKMEISGDKARAVAAVADALGGSGLVDTQDGVKVTMGRSWVHVRPSGTEPVVRVMAEAPSREEAEALAARAIAVLEGSGS